MPSARSSIIGPMLLFVLSVTMRPLLAEPPTRGLVANTDSPRASGHRPSKAATTIAKDHPLTSVLQYARHEQLYIQQHVRDFSCQLVKRERMDGLLRDYCYVNMWVRQELVDGDRVTQPLSIFLEFDGPAKVAGRRVLFVEGQHEGKMLVRNGGRRFDYVVAHIDPLGDNAMRESLIPITQSDFTRVLKQMIVILERHAKIDPAGENTEVQRIAGAKINQRPTSLIRVTHPKKQAGLEFHVAEVFVDDELRVPVRVHFSDWPRTPQQKPPLLAEYTYTNLELNVGLPDSMFTPAQLRAR